MPADRFGAPCLFGYNAGTGARSQSSIESQAPDIMNWQYDLYFFILLGAAVTSLLLAVSARRWRAAPGSTSFTFLMLAAAVWAFGASAELVAVTPAVKIAWSKLSYLGVVSVSPMWFVFAWSYSRRASWLTPRRLVLLWIVPATILVLAITNEWHGLIWSSITPTATALGTQMVYTDGIGVWVHAVYAYTLLFLGTCVLILTGVLSAHLYRGQIAALVLGAAAPWVGNLAYLFGWGPLPGLDLTPGAFALTGLVLALGLYRLQVLERVPMAHDVLFGVMNDGVLVLDGRQRLLDINPAAAAMVGLDPDSAIGKPIAEVVPALARWLGTTGADDSLTISLTDGLDVDVQVVPLQDGHANRDGQLIVLHDIAERKQMEQNLLQTNSRLRAQLAEIGNLHAQLRSQITRDPLTQLYNRLYLDEILPKEISRARRGDYALSVLMIDVDHFKRVNDTHGHEAGDSVMRALAAEIRALIRTGDTACRYGGDEIVCLLTDTALDDAGPRAEQLREAIAALSIPGPGSSIHVTLSIGVAAFPETGDDGDLILRAADHALYSAKAQGRNRVVLAHAATDVPQPD